MKIQEEYFEESINHQKMLTHYPPPQSDFGYPQQVLPSIDNVEAQSWFSTFLQSSPEGEDSMLNLRSDSQQSIQIPDWLSVPVSDSDRNVSESSLLLPGTEQEGVLPQPRSPLPPITEIPPDDLRLITAALANEELSSEANLLNQQKLKLPIIENGKNESMKLPGFHQAFGSTEIGRFSQHEEFFEAPQEGECISMHEADLLSKVNPAPVSIPTSKRGRGARNGTTRRTKASEKKYNKAANSNQINPPLDPGTLSSNTSEPCKMPPAIKTEKKEWESNSRDNDLKLNHLQNRVHESNYSGTNGFVPPSPYYNQTTRQDRYPSMHHNSYYNHHYCPSRYSKDPNPSQDRFLMSNSSTEMFRHPGNFHFQSSVESSLQQYPMGSQCWNQFGMYGSTPSGSHQSYSGMMSSYVSPPCDSLHSSEYKNYYYNGYSSCTEFDYQSSYSSNYFQQRSHPYRRMSYQNQPALPSFNNDRLHFNL